MNKDGFSVVRRAIRSCLVAAAISSTVGLSVALADTPANALKRTFFDIPAQPLATALLRFSEQAKVQVTAPSQLIGQRLTEGVRGQLDAAQALRQMLQGSGLSFEFINPGAVAIQNTGITENATAAAGVRYAAETQLGASQAAAHTISAEPDPAAEHATSGIEEILVRGRFEKLSTMKGDSTILEIPQNIQVLSSALLEDMGVVFLDDALRNVAGVVPGGIYNGFDYFRIRGFPSDAVYLDGLRLDNFTGINAELFGLDRLEVIKGPASTLYGDLFSGMVNLVSKRPKPETFLNLAVSGGTDSFFEPSLDFGGSLNKERTVYGRLALLYRKDGTSVDRSDGLDRYYVAPSLTWEISAASKLTLLAMYQRDSNELTRALPAYGTVLPNRNGKIPLDRYIGDGLNPTVTTYDMRSFGYQFTHEFSPALTLRQNARATWRSGHYDKDLSPLFLDPDQRTLYRYAASSDFDWSIYSIDTGLDANFATGGVEHHFTVGVDFARTSYDARSFYSDFGNPTAIPPLDLFDPAYTPIPDVPMYASPYDTSTRSVGLYVNDRIEFTDQLTLTAGGRVEHSTGGDSYVKRGSGTAFVPNVGLSYEIRQGLVAYANYSESFSPQYTLRLAGGEFPDPLRGKSWEAGVKTALLDERVNATLAVFNLERRNIAVADPTNPGFSVLTGQQRSRGVEIDSQILLTPNWQLLASYAYIYGEVLSSATVPVGSPLLNSPDHAFSLWMKYTIQGGLFDGLGFSLGGSTYSKQSGDFAHTFDLPAYTLVNANVSYRRNNFTAQINLINALDEEYFLGSYNTNIVLPGRPRAVRLTLGWSY